MATGAVQRPPVVLRVKRKREEDPVEALSEWFYYGTDSPAHITILSHTPTPRPACLVPSTVVSKHAKVDPHSADGSGECLAL